jgi:hypothetical protein
VPKNNVSDNIATPVLDEFTSRPTDKIQNQPGSALAIRLAKNIKYKPGIKTKLLGKIPGPLGEYHGNVKRRIQQRAVEYQVAEFAVAGRATKAFRTQLQDELTSNLGDMQGISKGALKKGKTYIDNKYDVTRFNLKFTNCLNGGRFKPEGTNLKGPIIRSQTGALYEMPEQIGRKDKKRLLSEKGLRLSDQSVTLGVGNFATVRIAKRLTADGSEFVAAKQFYKTPHAVADYAANCLRAEYEANCLLPESKYFSRLNDCAILQDGDAYLFMDLAGYGDGDAVATRISKIKDRTTRDDVKRTYAIECINAVQTLKKKNPPINHRDIKPANFLVTNKPQVMLGDFGVASIDNRFGVQSDGNELYAGTPAFIDPHWKMTGATAADAEKYSLGATLYILATGEFAKAGGTKGWKGYDAGKEDGKTLESVAKKLMDKDPKNRPNFDELLSLPYFAGNTVSEDVLKKHLKS